MSGSRPPEGGHLPRVHEDERGIIVVSILKILVGLAIAGLVAIETGTIIFSRLSIQDTAERVATAAAAEYDDSGSIEAAHDEAEEALEVRDDSAKLRRFVVNPQTGAVRIVVRKRANTLIVDKIGFLEGFAIAEGTAVGEPPTV